MIKTKIHVTYPPTFDGELHIDVTDKEKETTFQFTYAKKPGETPLEVLAKAAADILQYAQRMKR